LRTGVNDINSVGRERMRKEEGDHLSQLFQKGGTISVVLESDRRGWELSRENGSLSVAHSTSRLFS
jgi:hypothetical protein